MSDPTVPVYYELSWSILSTIGLLICIISIANCLLVGFTPLSLVPVITSGSCAIANGLCYYAFYADYKVDRRIAAAAFADIFWLIQEAGLSFYSYLILQRILRRKKVRWLFLTVFWTTMVAIATVRMVILVKRAISLKHAEQPDSQSNQAEQDVINHLHVAYFVLIAFAEVFCAIFLINIFSTAQKSSKNTLHNHSTSLFKLLARSTEIRLTLLAPIGITRSITYSFQATSQSATNTASQLDRFATTLECIFPIIFVVDLLVAKAKINTNGISASGRNNNGVNEFEPRGGLSSHGHNQSIWSRVVCTATAGGGVVGGGKSLEADEMSLTPESHMGSEPRVGDGEIMMRTQIRQTTMRVDVGSERTGELTRESSVV